MLDRMDVNAPRPAPPARIPSDEATDAAELTGGQLHTVSDVGLDPQKVARMVGECKRQVADLSARLNAIDDRKAELASRAICDGCQKLLPLGVVGLIVGDSRVCGHCNHVWSHTGLKPTGPNDPNLTRVEPSWGLNVKTIVDYVDPLPEVPRG